MAAASSAGATAAAEGFVSFVNKCPSPFHAVSEACAALVSAGYSRLDEAKPWDVVPGGKYFFTRNQSTLIAFALGAKFEPGNGFVAVGAHTDSPCLKVKPVSTVQRAGFLNVGVECYGGGLWHTWFDRDLTVAGRVMVKDAEGKFSQRLVHIHKPMLRIPTLAIHLNRTVNTEGFKFNKETELVPVLATSVKAQLEATQGAADEGPTTKRARTAVSQTDNHHPILLETIADDLGVDVESICNFELCLADTQPAVIGGIKEEFIFAPRLDNLLSSYCGLQALIASTSGEDALKDESTARVLMLYDHEEVGSQSAQGAASSLTEYVLRRLSAGGSATAFEEAVPKSLVISADMAHAIHPNYMSKHEDNHRPALHQGPVIKTNSNQRYATNAVTATVVKECAQRMGVPLQEFVVRNDSACGSTIGPIISAKLGMRTLDIGNPQLSMHSIREMCGVDGVEQATRLFESVFVNFSAVDATVTVD